MNCYLIAIALIHCPNDICIRGTADRQVISDQPLLGNVGCTLSKSGRFIMALGEFGRIAIWDCKTHKEIVKCESARYCTKEYKGIKYQFFRAQCACFDMRDEEKVLFCNTQGLYLWNWHEKKTPIRIIDSEHLANGNGMILAMGMAASSDGKKVLIIHGCGNVVVLALQNKHVVHFSTGRKLGDEWRDGAFFSADSESVIFNAGLGVKKYHLKNAKIDTIFALKKKDEHEIIIMGSGPREIMINSHKNGEIRLWSLKSNMAPLFINRKFNFGPISVSSDSKMAALENDSGKIVVYSIKDKKEIFSAPKCESGYSEIGFLTDNETIFAIGDFPEIRFWSISRKERLK